MNADISKEARKLFKAVPEKKELTDRVNWLRKMREICENNHGAVLEEAMRVVPGAVIEFIETTSLTPMVFSLRSGGFDHELENFIFCFDEANIHLDWAVTKALFEKIITESPEPTLYSMNFVTRYIEMHKNWRKFAEFVFFELFDGPRKGMIDPRTVLDNLSSINGLWPNCILDIVNTTPEYSVMRLGNTIMSGFDRAEKIESLKERWEETKKFREGRLSKEESEKVIAKLRELFF